MGQSRRRPKPRWSLPESAVYDARVREVEGGPGVSVDARHVVEVDAARAAPLTVVAHGRPLTPDRG
jgi:hypothetical protein